MKDLPHHIKKLNRSAIRSIRKENRENTLPDLPLWRESKSAAKKKEKQALKGAKKREPLLLKDPEERNREMKKGRVPVFDRNGGEPKRNRPSKKKTPRI